MKKVITFSALAIALSWSVWVWVRFPAPKTPNDKQVIQALTKQYETRLKAAEEAAWEDGYQKREIDRAWQHAIDNFIPPTFND